MAHSSSDREVVVSEGRYEVVSAEDGDGADYWLVAVGGDGATDEQQVPLERTEVDDLYAVVSRLRSELTDADDDHQSVELSCHSCGKAWTYTGSNEHVACPNCETEVPIEGIGP